MDARAVRKVDRRKQLADFYTAKATPKVVDVPPLDALMVDGVGDSNGSPDFSAAIEALYGVAAECGLSPCPAPMPEMAASSALVERNYSVFGLVKRRL